MTRQVNETAGAARWPRPLFHLWCLVLTGAVLWPFVVTLVTSLTPGDGAVSLVLRDMAVPHTMALNDPATGADGLPRAMPQDTILAWLSPVIPPPVVVSVLMLAGGYVGGLGAGALARTVGATGRFLVPALAAAVTLWNPFTAERLLQGHWSVVLAGFLLPAVALVAGTFAGRRLLFLIPLLLVCALTPTGLILAVVTALVASCMSSRPGPRALAVTVGGMVLSLPWVVPTLVNAGASATLSDAAGAGLFAARAEPWVGTLGALAGLGGIWNADAVPGSRDAFAPVSTLAGVVLALMAVGVAVVLLMRRQLRGTPLVWLAACAVVVPALMATGAGLSVTGWLVENLPGAGLIRDTQKFVVLALPGLVVLLAQLPGAVSGRSSAGRRARLGTVGVMGALALVWVSVPALPRDVSDLAPVALDDSYDRVPEQVGKWAGEHGREPRILLWPPGNYRMVEDRPVLDPLLKMLPGAPVDPGYLIVDGHLVDGDPDTVRLLNALAAGEDPLAGNGIDLVVTQPSDSDGIEDVPEALESHDPLWQDGADDSWRLYGVR
ncbi:MAG: hypothetical protein ACTH1D_02010 [Mycobacteriaceae bacterium]|uniref:hypothetical protein n=1 Tax=Corynebacterium sp. TaxID=1720 RepID=UPI003F950333